MALLNFTHCNCNNNLLSIIFFPLLTMSVKAKITDLHVNPLRIYPL